MEKFLFKSFSAKLSVKEISGIFAFPEKISGIMAVCERSMLSGKYYETESK